MAPNVARSSSHPRPLLKVPYFFPGWGFCSFSLTPYHLYSAFRRVVLKALHAVSSFTDRGRGGLSLAQGDMGARAGRRSDHRPLRRRVIRPPAEHGPTRSLDDVASEAVFPSFAQGHGPEGRGSNHRLLGREMSTLALSHAARRCPITGVTLLFFFWSFPPPPPAFSKVNGSSC